MDVVIPLGTGSQWNDTELKFALRSLEMHYPDMGNVYLVGEKPNWVKPKSIIHLIAIDYPGLEYKEANIMRKVYLACGQSSLSQKFIFLNDDHFLMSPIPPLPYYYERTLLDTLNSRTAHDSYYNSIANTLFELERRKKPTLNFDIHAPIIYDKSKFLEVMGQYDWSVHYGYLIKSLYCNTLGIMGTQYPDLKITSRLKCHELEALTKDRKFFSLGSTVGGSEMSTFLAYLYRNKSKYEL